jgi:hypothetical protein
VYRHTTPYTGQLDAIDHCKVLQVLPRHKASRLQNTINGVVIGQSKERNLCLDQPAEQMRNGQRAIRVSRVHVKVNPQNPPSFGRPP